MSQGGLTFAIPSVIITGSAQTRYGKIGDAGSNSMPGRKKKKKTFHAVTAVKEMARDRVGAPPAGQIVVEKKKKPEKYKPTLGKLLEER
jgi:hypothetical protein